MNQVIHTVSGCLKAWKLQFQVKSGHAASGGLCVQPPFSENQNFYLQAKKCIFVTTKVHMLKRKRVEAYQENSMII